MVPTGTSQTENVKIVSWSWYIDLQNYLVVVGEIQNTGTSTLSDVALSATATPPDGTSSDTGDRAWVTDLLPQQKAPFYLVFYSSQSSDGTWPSQGIGNIQVGVVHTDVTSSYLYPDLKIISQTQSIGTGTNDKGVFWVKGTVKNTGTQTAQNVSIVGTFYNSTGTTIAAGYTFPESMIPYSIPPGATATFELPAFDLDQTVMPSSLKIDHYSLLLQDIGPILQGTAPVIEATPTPGPVTTGGPQDTSSPTNAQTTTQPTDSGTTATASWIYPAIIVIVIAVIVVGALAVMSRKPKPQSKADKKKKQED